MFFNRRSASKCEESMHALRVAPAGTLPAPPGFEAHILGLIGCNLRAEPVQPYNLTVNTKREHPGMP